MIQRSLLSRAPSSSSTTGGTKPFKTAPTQRESKRNYGEPPDISVAHKQTNLVKFSNPVPPGITKYAIRYLPTAEILFNSRMALLGPTKCGKTSAMYHILNVMRFPRGVCMCGSPEASKTFSNFVPVSSIIPGFDERMLRNLIVYQKKMMAKVAQEVKEMRDELTGELDKLGAIKLEYEKLRLEQKAEERQWSATEFLRRLDLLEVEHKAWMRSKDRLIAERVAAFELQKSKEIAVFVIIDDLSSDGDLKSHILKHLMNNGRHYAIFPILTVQRPVDLPPGCRQGLDWIVVWDDISQNNLQFIHKQIASVFPNEREFFWYVKEAQRMKCALVFRKNHGATTIEESVFFFKSEPIPMRCEPLVSQSARVAHDMFFDIDAQNESEKRFAEQFKTGDKGKKRGKPSQKEIQAKERQEAIYKEQDTAFNFFLSEAASLKTEPINFDEGDTEETTTRSFNGDMEEKARLLDSRSKVAAQSKLAKESIRRFEELARQATK